MENLEQKRPRVELIHAELTESVLGAFYEVYNHLRFGFLEAVYSESLFRELTKRGHSIRREALIAVFYKGEQVGVQRVDMIVDDRLLLEIKSTHDLSKASHRQVLSYLRGSELELGLLLHFGPEAKFYRVISSNAPTVAKDPPRSAGSA